MDVLISSAEHRSKDADISNLATTLATAMTPQCLTRPEALPRSVAQQGLSGADSLSITN